MQKQRYVIWGMRPDLSKGHTTRRRSRRTRLRRSFSLEVHYVLALSDLLLNRIRQQLDEFFRRTILDRLLGHGDYGAMPQTGWLETGERSALPCPVDPDHRLEEVLVGYLPSFRTLCPGLENLLEVLRDFCLGLLGHERQHGSHVAAV